MSCMEMQQIWEKYVLENSLDSFIIDKTIIDSWQLSKKFKVNPKDGIGKRFLTTSDFQKRLRDHETMVSLAKKSLNRFQFLLKNIDFILVLTDADGYILWQSGNEHLKEHAREIRFSQGYQWTESMVGTNSIGIALRTKEANFIHGYEHFARASHNWSCVASPVFGENREVVGVVDLSMPAHYPKKEDFLFTVQLIAEFISEALQRKVFEEQKYMLQYFSSKKQPGILCNSSMTILHISPELVDEPEAYIGKKLSALPNEKWEIVKRDPI